MTSKHRTDELASGATHDDWRTIFVQAMVKVLDSDTEQNNPDLVAAIDRIQEILFNPTVTVVFGGRSSCGKSSLIDALLGRHILPTSEDPDTGALCVITSGDSDRAIAHYPSGPCEIPCTMESIREVVSRVKDGDFRPIHELASRVEVTLFDAPIPRGVRWIDSPGIDDAGEMHDRTRVALGEADVVFWISDTRQSLIEQEVEFLRPFLNERGPRAIVFLLNAFMENGTESEWTRFTSERLPVSNRRLQDRLALLGLPDDLDVHFRMVSAHQLQKPDEAGFGRVQLLAALADYAAAGNPAVQQARFFRAGHELEVLSDQKREVVGSMIAGAERARDDECVAAEKCVSLRPTYLATIPTVVTQYISAMNETSARVAGQINAEIGVGALHRDNRYGTALKTALNAAAETEMTSLFELMDVIADRFQQPRLSEDSKSRILPIVRSSTDLAVEVPQGATGMGTGMSIAGGAAAGARAGGLFGAVIGGAMAAFAKTQIVDPKAEAGHVDTVHANVRSQTRQWMNWLLQQRERLEETFVAHSPIVDLPCGIISVDIEQRLLGQFEANEFLRLSDWSLAVASGKATWTVANDGTGDFTSIQDAIDAAQSGDVVLVREGLYIESVTIEKAILLQGEGNDSILQSNGGPSLLLKDSLISVYNLTVKQDVASSMGAIVVSGGRSRFENVDVRVNPGIEETPCLTIQDSAEVTMNLVRFEGGVSAVRIRSKGSAELKHCIGSRLGTVLILEKESASAQMTFGLFTDINYAVIARDFDALDIENSLFIALSGPAIVVENGDTLRLRRITIKSNGPGISANGVIAQSVDEVFVC